MNTNRSTKTLAHLFLTLLAVATLLSNTTRAYAFTADSAKQPNPETGPAGQPTQSPVYDATSAREEAIVYSNEVQAQVIPVTGAKPAPYDATAAMRAAVIYSHEVKPNVSTRSFYDATAAMRAAIMYSHEVEPIPPVAAGENTGD